MMMIMFIVELRDPRFQLGRMDTFCYRHRKSEGLIQVLYISMMLTYLLSMWVWMQTLQDSCEHGLYLVSLTRLKQIGHRFSSSKAFSCFSFAIVFSAGVPSLLSMESLRIFLHMISISNSASILLYVWNILTSNWLAGLSSLRTISSSLLNKLGSNELILLIISAKLSNYAGLRLDGICDWICAIVSISPSESSPPLPLTSSSTRWAAAWEFKMSLSRLRSGDKFWAAVTAVNLDSQSSLPVVDELFPEEDSSEIALYKLVRMLMKGTKNWGSVRDLVCNLLQ